MDREQLAFTIKFDCDIYDSQGVTRTEKHETTVIAYDIIEAIEEFGRSRPIIHGICYIKGAQEQTVKPLISREVGNELESKGKE